MSSTKKNKMCGSADFESKDSEEDDCEDFCATNDEAWRYFGKDEAIAHAEQRAERDDYDGAHDQRPHVRNLLP
jgi:hypothetical protein